MYVSHRQAREATPDPNIAWCFLVKGLGWWPYGLVLLLL